MNVNYIIAALIVHGVIALTTLAATVAICRTEIRAVKERLKVLEQTYVSRRELDLRLKNIETWARRSYRMLRKARLLVNSTEQETK